MKSFTQNNNIPNHVVNKNIDKPFKLENRTISFAKAIKQGSLNENENDLLYNDILVAILDRLKQIEERIINDQMSHNDVSDRLENIEEASNEQEYNKIVPDKLQVIEERDHVEGKCIATLDRLRPTDIKTYTRAYKTTLDVAKERVSGQISDTNVINSLSN